MVEHDIQKTQHIHFKAIDIGASEDTTAQEYRVRIHKPYAVDSLVRPESVDLQVLVWENPKPEKLPEINHNNPIQIVIIGGFAINPVEVGSEITQLLKYSNKIVGIAHPDAPQSKISPNKSPFNEINTFQNSGIAVYETIRTLIQNGVLDGNHPVTLVGFSTGAAVATETAAIDFDRHKERGENRCIANLVALVAPAGLHNYSSAKELRDLAIASGPKHMASFLEDLAKRKYLKRALNKQDARLTDLDPSGNPDSFLNHVRRMNTREKILFLLQNILETTKNPIINPVIWLKQTLDAGKRLFGNIQAMKTEFFTDPVWMKIAIPHILFELGEFIARSVPSEELKNLLWHFHVMWKDQGPQGEPHFTPQSSAVARSSYNLAHLSGLTSAAKIQDTNILVMLGVNDPVVDPKRLLSHEERANMDQLQNQDKETYITDRVIARVQNIFPNAVGRVRTEIITGPDSHHLWFRRHAKDTALAILRYSYPNVL